MQGHSILPSQRIADAASSNAQKGCRYAAQQAHARASERSNALTAHTGAAERVFEFCRGWLVSRFSAAERRPTGRPVIGPMLPVARTIFENHHSGVLS